MKNLCLAVALGVLALSAGCGGGDKKAGDESKEAPAASLPPAAPVTDPASISGKVIFSGTKPEIRTISMDATPSCARLHKEPQKSEEVVLNSNGTLRWTFVWVKEGLPERSWPMPQGAVSIDQSGCIYKPHVAAVRVGQDVEFLNSDPTNHNIHPLPKVNQEWNESQPPKGDSKMKHFAREEVMIAVKCNVHPWMRSYIGVVGHPFFAVTGEDGSFSIKGLPPGKYTLQVWHEKLGTKDVEVEVGAKESKTVDFELKQS